MARDLKFDEDGIDEHVIVKRKKEIFLINLRRSAHAMRLKETNALKC